MGDDTPSLLMEAAAYLEGQEKNIIFRWVQLASRLPGHFRRPGESLQELVDHMPQILAQLRQLMLVPVDPAGAPALPPETVEEHARARYERQIPASTVVKEFQLLRHEIWATLRQWQQARQLTAMDVFLLEEKLNFMLDEIISVTLDKFVDLMAEGGNGGDVETANDHGGG